MPALIKALQVSTLPPELTVLLRESEIPELFDQSADLDLEDRLDQLLQSNPGLNASSRAGLWLFVGNLMLSHAISQELKTKEGSYWHGIMHRRERDFWNSKYWFQKVGDHPAMFQIAEVLKVELGDSIFVSSCVRRGKFDPSLFTDLCAALSPGDSASQAELRAIGWIEWQFLFLYGLENG